METNKILSYVLITLLIISCKVTSVTKLKEGPELIKEAGNYVSLTKSSFIFYYQKNHSSEYSDEQLWKKYLEASSIDDTLISKILAVNEYAQLKGCFNIEEGQFYNIYELEYVSFTNILSFLSSLDYELTVYKKKVEKCWQQQK